MNNKMLFFFQNTPFSRWFFISLLLFFVLTPNYTLSATTTEQVRDFENIPLFHLSNDSSLCEAVAIPYFYDFETDTATLWNEKGYIPLCWNRLGNGTDTTFFPHICYDTILSGKRLVLISGDSSIYGTHNYIVLPYIVENYNDLMISFSTRMDNDSIGHLSFGYIQNDNDTIQYVALMNIDGADSTVTHNISLRDFIIPTETRLCFLWNNADTDTCARCYIDDIFIDSLQLCLAPQNVHITDLTLNSISMSWERSWNEQQWLIEYGVDGFAHGMGTFLTVSEEGVEIDTLLPATTYDIYLASLCPNGDTSTWTAVTKFTTPCSPLQLPYYEDFESYPAHPASEAGVIPDCWDKWTTGLPKSQPHISTDLAPNGKALLLAASSSPNDGSPHYVILPSFTSDLNGTQISFTSKMSNNRFGVLTLGYITNLSDQSTFVALEEYTNTTTAETHITSLYKRGIPTGARLAFRWAFSQATMTFRCAIDNIAIEFLTCPTIQNLQVDTLRMTTAQISWNKGDYENMWNVEYGVHGFEQGHGDTLFQTTDSVIYLTNLIGEQPYDLYVQAICDPLNPSTYSDPITFTPYCSTYGEITPITACDSFEWHHHTFFESGTYIDTLFRSGTDLCDSICTLDLTINHSYNQTEELTLCQNELPYSWRDTVLQEGSHDTLLIFHRISSQGCDSTVSLYLTIHPAFYQEESLTICQQELPYTWRDTVFQIGTISNSYNFTRHSYLGCDSIVTLHLTVNPSYYETFFEDICQNELPFTWRDTTFQVGTESGVFTFNRQTHNGCDSITTFVLIVRPSYIENHNIHICKSDLPYTWRDTTFDIGSQSGYYHFPRHTVYGCDSIVNLTLTIHELSYYEESVSLCESELPYIWHDTIFSYGSQSGTYQFLRTNAAGCDSMITLSLYIYPLYEQHLYETRCDNEFPYTIFNTTFPIGSRSGEYRFDYTSQHGCDSIIYFHLTVNPTHTEQAEAAICISELENGWQWRDTTFYSGTESGVYTFHRSNITGCDSTVTLTLTVHPTYTFEDYLTVCANELPTEWRGNVIPLGSESSDIVFHKFSAHGCDSITTLHLTVYPTYRQEVNLTICQNELPYRWRDITFPIGSLGGTFLYERISSHGCDSIVILTLKINVAKTEEINESICINELNNGWNWRDTTFHTGTQTGTFTFYRHTSHGCDSIVRLNLHILPTYVTDDYITICQSELPYYYSAARYTFPIGTHSHNRTFRLTSTAGCDSTVTLHLTVLPVYNRTRAYTICASELPFNCQDTIFPIGTRSGTYSFHYNSVGGCDSIISIRLTVNPTYNETTTEEICQNDLPYQWRDITFPIGTTTGIYHFSRTTSMRCDSLVTLALIVNPSYEEYDTLNICENDFPYICSDTSFTTQPDQRDFSFYYHSIKGCDSIRHIHLNIHPTYSENEHLGICENDLPYTWRDTTFETGSSSNEFVFYRRSVHGCDSIIHLSLTIFPSYNQNDYLEVCDADMPYLWHGELIPEAGNYTYSYVSENGCDSIWNVSLIVKESTEEFEEVSICKTDLPYIWRNYWFGRNTETLDTTFHAVGANQCDSIIHLHLIVHPTYELSTIANICQNELPYTWRDTIFDTNTALGTTMHYFHKQTVMGCDSSVTLRLTVYPMFEQETSLTLCHNDFPYTWRDTTFQEGTMSGDYVFHRNTRHGCDSIVILHLTVGQSSAIYDTVTICNNDLPYYLVSEHTWLQHAGDYTYHHTTSLGCDSTFYFRLNVNQSYQENEMLTLCADELPYTWRDTTFDIGSVSNDFVFHRTTVLGCDSIVTLMLTIYDLPTINISGNTIIHAGESTRLSATYAVGYQYQWSTGENYPFIDVNPIDTTTYTLTITNNHGCNNIDSITIFVIPDTIGITTYTQEKSVLIYPNPTSDILNIQAQQQNIHIVELYAIDGRLIRRIKVDNLSTMINVSHFQKGHYMLILHMKDGTILRKKVLIQ